jgi:hypothetical protein
VLYRWSVTGYPLLTLTVTSCRLIDQFYLDSHFNFSHEHISYLLQHEKHIEVSKEDWCQTVVIMFELAISPSLILLLLNGRKETKKWQDCNLPLREKC